MNKSLVVPRQTILVASGKPVGRPTGRTTMTSVDNDGRLPRYTRRPRGRRKRAAETSTATAGEAGGGGVKRNLRRRTVALDVGRARAEDVLREYYIATLRESFAVAISRPFIISPPFLSQCTCRTFYAST